MSELAALFDKVPTWVWVASILGVTLLGFIDLLRQARGTAEKLAFSSEFRGKFIAYVNSRGQNREAYHEMMLQSNRMQAVMGPYGVWDYFRDPPFVYKKYGIILNVLPRIRQKFEEGRLYGHVDDFIRMVDDALVRFLGTLDDELRELRRSLRNPFTCFRRGAEQIVLLTVLFFAAFGVIDRATVASIRAAWVFKFVTAALALLHFTASVIALLVDGSEAWGIVRGWLWGASTPADAPAVPSSGSDSP